MEVLVTGIGLLTGLGDRETSWKRLLAGESAIALHCPFPELGAFPLARIGQKPADLKQLLQIATQEALSDAQVRLPLADCGVAIGSSRGYQARLEQFARDFYQRLSQAPQVLPATSATPPQPFSWLDSLPHMGAIAVARQVGTTGPVLAPMAACATGIWAIAQGADLIRQGCCDRVIVGSAEAPITPLALAGFKRMGALAKTGSYPFDRRREGLVLGEGAAVLVLESAALAKQRDAPVYGRILGVGLTADGYHVSAPAADAKSAIAAIQQCLQRSNLSAADIDLIHTHGTGTQLNDGNEAQLIQQLFPRQPFVASTKGATGHTLGASGCLGVVFCLLALRDRIVPPCAGLQHPEFDLNFACRAYSVRTRQALCFSFGFGGQNAVIALDAG